MSQLRRDPIGGRWIIVDSENPFLPPDFEYEPQEYHGGQCPFCYGSEAATPKEVDSIRDSGTHANTVGWQVRVVSNKFPALQIEGNLDRRGVGIYDMSNGVGAHEVLIETPYHQKDICELVNSEVVNFLTMYTRRAIDLARDKRFKYVMIFKNFGFSAGASMEHPHTQIIALPMIPKNVTEELKGARNYFEYRERCIFCDIIRQELQEKERVVAENKYFISFCPYVSRFPFEIWIMPKKHHEHFCNTTHGELAELAAILRETVARVKAVFPDAPYNYMIHSSPVNSEAEIQGYHWHIEFMPKLTRTAGFEWGSGFYVVNTPPELAAKYLREVSPQLIG